jgi:uncharacterized protein
LQGDDGVVNAGVLAVLSGLAAQLAKVLIEVARHREWRPELAFANGGMPSSHTSSVTTLAILVGHQSGVHAPVFSLVLVFAFYVVFEATGLRQEVGQQARLLNELMDAAKSHEQVDRARLREIVGHTWAEVLVGAAFGAVFALALQGFLKTS